MLLAQVLRAETTAQQLLTDGELCIWAKTLQLVFLSHVARLLSGDSLLTETNLQNMLIVTGLVPAEGNVRCDWQCRPFQGSSRLGVAVVHICT